jgi:serine phosphatase RsbU (regulator of sigma subunit)
LQSRPSLARSTEVAEVTLVSPGDTLFLYTDGVYDGSDDEQRQQLEAAMHEYCRLPARDIRNALLELALKKDDHLRQKDN